MPGDLVMAFASDINHPAIEEGLIHRNYILVGVVQSFTDVVWDTGYADDDWDGKTTQERLKVLWCDIKGWDKGHANQPEHPLNQQVKVISVTGDGNLNKINPEFKSLIEDQFEFVNGKWKFRRYM